MSKTAKELADFCRTRVPLGFTLNAEELNDIATHLEAKAAIDSAVPGEVGEIQERYAGRVFAGGGYQQVTKDLGSLLTIVQRQAGEMVETRRGRDAENERLEETSAEVERYSQRELAFTHGDPPAEKLPRPLACPNCGNRDSWLELPAGSDFMQCKKYNGGCGYSMSLDANEPENLRAARDLLRAEVGRLNAELAKALCRRTQENC